MKQLKSIYLSVIVTLLFILFFVFKLNRDLNKEYVEKKEILEFLNQSKINLEKISTSNNVLNKELNNLNISYDSLLRKTRIIPELKNNKRVVTSTDINKSLKKHVRDNTKFKIKYYPDEPRIYVWDIDTNKGVITLRIISQFLNMENIFKSQSLAVINGERAEILKSKKIDNDDSGAKQNFIDWKVYTYEIDVKYLKNNENLFKVDINNLSIYYPDRNGIIGKYSLKIDLNSDKTNNGN